MAQKDLHNQNVVLIEINLRETNLEIIVTDKQTTQIDGFRK